MNGRFLPIPLDRKKKGDRHLFDEYKGVKIRGTFSEDGFLIIPLYYLSFCFSRTSVGVSGKDHIGKSEKENPGLSSSIADRDRKKDKPDIGTDITDIDNIDEGVNNSGRGIDIANKDRRADNPDIATNIVDTDSRADNLGISIGTDKASANRRIDDLDIGINIVDADADRRADPGTGTKKADIDSDGKADPGKDTSIANADTEEGANNPSKKIADIDE